MLAPEVAGKIKDSLSKAMDSGRSAVRNRRRDKRFRLCGRAEPQGREDWLGLDQLGPGQKKLTLTTLAAWA